MARDTSVLTYLQLLEEGKLSRREKDVYILVLHYPDKTARELCDIARASDTNEIKPRLTDLYRKGILMQGDKRICAITKRLAYTWTINDIVGKRKAFQQAVDLHAMFEAPEIKYDAQGNKLYAPVGV